jgi:hypothetical protein
MAKEKVYDATFKKFVEIEVDNREDSNYVDNKKIGKRIARNNLLFQSDWALLQDSPLTDEQKEEAIVYRQALRDISSHAEFPDNEFPNKPDFL